MKSISKEKIFITILILFSLLINQYYGNRGIFPVDSFAHFDTGFRILSGEYPFKNYWIISGPFVDYIQAIFFYLFGVNLSAANLTDANLVAVDLTGANLTRTNLTGANLANVYIRYNMLADLKSKGAIIVGHKIIGYDPRLARLKKKYSAELLRSKISNLGIADELTSEEADLAKAVWEDEKLTELQKDFKIYELEKKHRAKLLSSIIKRNRLQQAKIERKKKARLQQRKRTSEAGLKH